MGRTLHIFHSLNQLASREVLQPQALQQFLLSKKQFDSLVRMYGRHKVRNWSVEKKADFSRLTCLGGCGMSAYL